MATVQDSGSQTATLTSEHTLATVTAAGTYQLVVDVANLAAGETLWLRIYGKARSSDTERLLYSHRVKGETLVELLIASLAVVSPHHSKFTLRQDGGTGRAFPWAIYAL